MKRLVMENAGPDFSKEGILNDPAVSSTWKGTITEKSREKNAEVKNFIDNEFPDEKVISTVGRMMPDACPPVNKPSERKEWLEIARQKIYETATEMEEDQSIFEGPPELLYEKKFQDVIPGFVPPVILRAQDQHFDIAWKTLLKGARAWKSANIKRVDGLS